MSRVLLLRLIEKGLDLRVPLKNRNGPEIVDKAFMGLPFSRVCWVASYNRPGKKFPVWRCDIPNRQKATLSQSLLGLGFASHQLCVHVNTVWAP